MMVKSIILIQRKKKKMSRPLYHLPKIEHRKFGICQKCGRKTILLRTTRMIPFRMGYMIYWLCESCRPIILLEWKERNDKTRWKGRKHYNY